MIFCMVSIRHTKSGQATESLVVGDFLIVGPGPNSRFEDWNDMIDTPVY